MSFQAVPEIVSGAPSLEGCVQVETVHQSSIAHVILWRCLCEDGRRAERCHRHHVLSVGVAGASLIHDGARRVIVDPATAVLHRPGSAYRTTHPYGCNDSGISIGFRDDVADEAYRLLRPRSDAPAVAVSMRPMRLALQQFVLALRRRDGLAVDAVAMDELALEMLGAALGARLPSSAAARARTRDDHGAIADATREYLNAHFRGPVRLDDIARAVGASPFHLSRVFRRHTGLALRSYLQRLRLGAAVHAITASDTPITRIALDAGFASHAHLTALFAREMGVPPSHVRGLLTTRRPADLKLSPLFAAPARRPADAFKRASS